MANENELFDQQIHDAFDKVELSEEAQDRMLAILLAAQERTQVREVPADAEPSEAAARVAEPGEAEVIPVPPRRMPWQRWLPLAAVLVLAIVVVRVTSLGGKAASEQSVGAAAADSAVAPGESAKSLGEAEESATANELASPTAYDAEAEDVDELESTWPVGLVETYPRITLEDGTVLTALRDAQFVDEVDSERVGELVATGTATPFDATESVPCEVYRLLNEDDAYAVRYEDEETFWRCTPSE